MHGVSLSDNLSFTFRSTRPQRILTIGKDSTSATKEVSTEHTVGRGDLVKGLLQPVGRQGLTLGSGLFSQAAMDPLNGKALLVQDRRHPGYVKLSQDAVMRQERYHSWLERHPDLKWVMFPCGSLSFSLLPHRHAADMLTSSQLFVASYLTSRLPLFPCPYLDQSRRSFCMTHVKHVSCRESFINASQLIPWF